MGGISDFITKQYCDLGYPNEKNTKGEKHAHLKSQNCPSKLRRIQSSNGILRERKAISELNCLFSQG